jgi:hypothetical protein
MAYQEPHRAPRVDTPHAAASWVGGLFDARVRSDILTVFGKYVAVRKSLRSVPAGRGTWMSGIVENLDDRRQRAIGSRYRSERHVLLLSHQFGSVSRHYHQF